jgi:pre-mRNA-splicing factor ATP-dependent RNA helicase DHX38/PRP16
MLTSGLFKINNIRMDLEEDDDKRVVLMLHDIKPPFLGRQENQHEQERTDPDRERHRYPRWPSFSKKGSTLIAQMRERTDKTKMRETVLGAGGFQSLVRHPQHVKQRDDETEDSVQLDDEGNFDYQEIKPVCRCSQQEDGGCVRLFEEQVDSMSRESTYPCSV